MSRDVLPPVAGRLDMSQVGTMMLGYIGAVCQLFRPAARAQALEEAWTLLDVARQVYGNEKLGDGQTHLSIVNPASFFSFCGTCMFLSSPETFVQAATKILGNPDYKRGLLELIMSHETKPGGIAMQTHGLMGKPPVGQA